VVQHSKATVLQGSNTATTGLWQATQRRSGAAWAQTLAAVATGSALLALSAHVQVPLWPVRLSMQSFVALAIGVACGGRLGTATLLAYLAEGALGLPVFLRLEGGGTANPAGC